MVDYQDVFSDAPSDRLGYYDPASNGRVRWWDWAAGLFFTLTAWMIGQILFAVGLGAAMFSNDMASELQTMGEVTGGNAALSTIGSWMLGLGMLVGVVTGLVYYLSNRAPGLRIVMILAIAATFTGLIVSSAFQGEMDGFNDLLGILIGRHAWLYALFLLTFPAALAGLYFVWRVIHAKSLTSLHTSFERFRWGRVVQAFIIGWAVLFAFSFIGGALTGNAPEWQFDASRFFVFAAISLLLLPIQSATEEIVVRGYMNKGLIALFANKWVAFVLTSGLFTALHLSNPEALSGAEEGKLAIVMSGYFFFGFAACLMVLIDDGLESAIAVHAANNTFAGVFVNYEGSVLPTPSLWMVESQPTADSLGTIVVLLVILGLLWVTRQRSLSRSNTL